MNVQKEKKLILVESKTPWYTTDKPSVIVIGISSLMIFLLIVEKILKK